MYEMTLRPTSLTCGEKFSSSSGFVASDWSFKYKENTIKHNMNINKCTRDNAHKTLNRLNQTFMCPVQSSPKENQTDKEADSFLPQGAKSYHFPNVWEQTIAKILSSLNGKLRRQVVNRAHENAVSFHTVKRKKRREKEALWEVCIAPF